MALSGTITGSTDNQYIDAKITWSATQSVDGNYSMVTATLYYSRNNTGYTTYGTWSGKITINGTATSASKSLTITYNSNTKAISATVKVPHNSDGTKTISISASGSISGTSLGSTSVSGSVTLNTIPRASSVSMSTGTMGSASTIKITRASSGFTHTLTYKLGSKTVTIATKTSSTSVSWTPQIADFAAQIPKATYGTGTLTCTTYNGTTSVGSKSISVRLNLPSSVKPSVGSLTLTPATITLLNPANGAATTSTVSILVQNKNKLTLKASGAAAGTGSTIAYYTFSGPSYSQKVTSTSTSASISISSVSNTGTLTYKVTATDARGRTSAAVSKTITCYAYTTPSISSFSAYRADSSGNKSANGTYLKCTYTPTYSSVNSTNAATVTAYYNGSSTTGGASSVLINLNGDTSTTYKVYLTVRDKYGGYKTTSTKTVYGQFRVFNITSDGTGIAFGKMAESKSLFECRWNAKFNGLVNIVSKLTAARGRFTATTDASMTAQNDVPLRIGNESGEHLDIDANEIIAKDSPTTTGTLAFGGTFIDSYIGDTLTFRVGSDETSEYIRSIPTYSRTYDSSPNMYITSNGVLGRATSSSMRYKTEIEDVSSVDLDPYNILDIPVRQYKYADGYVPIGKQSEDIYIGLVAEEVAQAYPAAAEYREDGQVEMWNIKVLFPALLKIVQDQQKEIEYLKNAINKEQNV